MSDKLSEQVTDIVNEAVACALGSGEIADLVKKVAALEQQLAEKDAEIARLQEAANKLAWACEVQITTTNNSRAFRNQHKEKCRYWIAQMRAALAETPAAPEVK